MGAPSNRRAITTRPGMAKSVALAARRVEVKAAGMKSEGVVATDIIVSRKTGATWGSVDAYLVRKGFVGARRVTGLKTLAVLHRRGRIGFRDGVVLAEPALIEAQ